MILYKKSPSIWEFGLSETPVIILRWIRGILGIILDQLSYIV